MDRKVIEIKNLNYSYPDGTQALSGINLDIFEGESVGIIGPNGAGKSTLLLHLNGIIRTDNCVRIFDMDICDKNLAQVRRKVGLVFQDPENQLFMPTVFDDVSFGPINMGLAEGEVRSSVKNALEEVDMLDSMKRSSHHLSFGEKKRVSIATVLSMRPQILALDEPTSNLDPRHRRLLINLLKKLALTKVIATHDLFLIRDICSRVVLLDKGRIAAAGRTQEILADKDLIEAHGLEMC